MRLVFVAALVMLPIVAWALGQAPETKKESDSKSGELIISAPLAVNERKTKTIAHTGNSKQQVVLSEKGQDYRVACDKLVYFEETETAELSGSLRYTNPDTAVTAVRAVVDFDKKLVIFSESVKVLSRQREKPEPAIAGGENKALSKSEGAPTSKGSANARSATEEKKPAPVPTTLTADKFEFNYEARQGTATGNLKIVQEDRTATAFKALFDEKKNVMTLEGNVEMQEKNNTARVSRIVINVDEDTWAADDSEARIIRKSKQKDPGKGKSPDSRS